MRTDFQLGDRLVRPRRDCIERDGQVVHVTPKAMAVLERLARAAGEVVTRDELFNSVWPGSAVTDDALTQCIVELRKALGDSARDPQFIETIPKVGFRLLPGPTPLATGDEAAEGAPGRAAGSSGAKPGLAKARPVLLVIAVVLIGFMLFRYLPLFDDAPPPGDSGRKSLVVLPFLDMSEQQDQGWYADGMTEELTNRLAQLDGLQVAGRTSAFGFKDRHEDIRQIGEALGVEYLIEGSVRTDGDNVRITAQLIRAADGFHVWSKQYDRPRADIFEVQQEIAEAVATALSLRLQVGQHGAIPGGTDSVEAFELLQMSKRYQWQATPDSMLQAIDYVKQSLELDPGYAAAWYRLAGLYVNTHSIRHGMDDTDWMALAEEAAEHARSIEPDYPDLKYLTVTILYVNRKWSEIEQLMDRGAGLEASSDFNLLFGWTGFLMRTGRVREAVPLLERMHRIKPSSPGAAAGVALAYATVGRIDDGIAVAEVAFGLDGFKVNTVDGGLRIALAAGDPELLATWLQRAEEFMPRSRDLIRAMMETLGDPDAALAYLRSALAAGSDPDILIPRWAAHNGDYDLALAAMRQAPAPAYFWGREVQEVRRLPGFKDLVRQVGLEDYFREYGWNDFCRPVGPEDFECE